jgi:hypothetical protein
MTRGWVCNLELSSFQIDLVYPQQEPHRINCCTRINTLFHAYVATQYRKKSSCLSYSRHLSEEKN